MDDAVELAKVVTAQRLRRLGPAHPDTLTSRMGLIRAVAAAGDVSPAVALLNAAMGDAEATHGPDHPITRAVLECGENSGVIHRRG